MLDCLCNCYYLEGSFSGFITFWIQLFFAVGKIEAHFCDSCCGLILYGYIWWCCGLIFLWLDLMMLWSAGTRVSLQSLVKTKVCDVAFLVTATSWDLCLWHTVRYSSRHAVLCQYLSGGVLYPYPSFKGLVSKAVALWEWCWEVRLNK